VFDIKIVIASDSFKGSLSSLEVGLAIQAGVQAILPDANTVVIPVADGGEGTMESLVAATQGRMVQATVTGPLGNPVQASYGLLGDGVTCVIEMASASGLGLVTEVSKNPLITTTYGTGELIKMALDEGRRHFILGVGGSATNDGGAGMLQALGIKLTDADGNTVSWGGGNLQQIAEIDDSAWDPRIAACQFLIASDVQNPLLGIQGASHIFGPQKGADAEKIHILEQNMQHWADLILAKTGRRLHDLPGAGAAGGLGGAFQAFFPAQMRRGIDIVIEYTGLDQAMLGADLLFTGEGRIDSQTASGKTPMGIAQRAQQELIPVFVLAGSVGEGIEVLYQYGITSIHSIVNSPMSLESAMDQTAKLLTQRTEQIMRTFLAGKTRLDQKKGAHKQ
jgi:glycerate kinase